MHPPRSNGRRRVAAALFTGYGLADCSGGAEASGVAAGAGLESKVDEGGAVVVSGNREAGGGSETSLSDGGKGANSFDDGGASSERLCSGAGFRFFGPEAAAVTDGA